MRLAPWIIAAILAFAAWRLYSSRDIEPAAGQVAAAEPEQDVIEAAPGIRHGAFMLRPRADFHATVRDDRIVIEARPPVVEEEQECMTA